MKWLYAICYIYAAAVLIQARINWLTQKQILALLEEIEKNNKESK